MPRSFNEPWEPEDIFDRAEAAERRARRERMVAEAAQRQAEEDRKRTADLASAREFSMKANAHQITAEYRAAGVKPIEVNARGVPTVSLSLLLSIGWTIHEIDGVKKLIRPVPIEQQPQRRRRNQEIGS